ncbi:hypothetical protein P7K49_019330 [Saguinus oedipus]|uniref:Uncharacterized protein n=1 Tax=Saguinus oedipus TaxID=9490 RepID=A0ABQ9UY07_SAGOE|nr:hypothetical protein P7K49_019330 [Saguinus oedipus]
MPTEQTRDASSRLTQPAPAASSAGATAGPGVELTARVVGSGTGDHTDPSALSAGSWGATWGEEERERERTDSEAGSWVIGLGGSHAHGDKQGGDWMRLGLRVLLLAFRTVQPGQGGASTIPDEVHPHLSTAQD